MSPIIWRKDGSSKLSKNPVRPSLWIVFASIVGLLIGITGDRLVLSYRLTTHIVPNLAATIPMSVKPNLPINNSVVENKNALQSVLDGSVRQDVVSAAAWIQALPPSELRNQSWTSVLSCLARNDPESAVTWALHFLDNNQRGKALAQVSLTYSQADPQLAAEWLSSLEKGQKKIVLLYHSQARFQ